MNRLKVFVSSTCYDLSQLRTDLQEFINDAGHTSILSEYNNFPVNPQLSTIENCIKSVKDNADILILIVGNRYGSMLDNGKSITNTEFLTAQEKGIPVYCFIEKRTLHALDFWRDNKDGNFDSFVDNKKIFEFVENIRNDSKIWTFEFERAQDIIATLKAQFSYLFKNSLRIKSIFENQIPEYFKLSLSNQALKILIEKPDYYEYAFFIQTWVDEIEKKRDFYNNIKYALLHEPKHYVHTLKEIPTWAQERLASLLNISSSLNNLINVALPEFINEPGIPSDLRGLNYVSRTYANMFERFVIWKIDTNSTILIEKHQKISKSLSNMAKNLINEVWDAPFQSFKAFSEAAKRYSKGERNIQVVANLKLTLDPDEMKNLENDIEALKIDFERDI
ncbi:DUF4062 domain-containing protein [Niabella beijingensis]|uniref:DUF4062 domain-containing protein n=1 Tax=Niabella beijingensis TaxID=2872700 RepID=UPI001CC0D67E|nr:DUF4062 domain-containing protein [Niabella beijingensis]MBZ4190643.1 DUF4062 domain-containing protein [Niabella beijingensis]